MGFQIERVQLFPWRRDSGRLGLVRYRHTASGLLLPLRLLFVGYAPLASGFAAVALIQHLFLADGFLHKVLLQAHSPVAAAGAVAAVLSVTAILAHAAPSNEDLAGTGLGYVSLASLFVGFALLAKAATDVVFTLATLWLFQSLITVITYGLPALLVVALIRTPFAIKRGRI